MPHLPEELLYIVLSRLTVKSLLRFRCVSKIWLNLITSPYFVNLHSNHNEQCSKIIMIIKGYADSIYARDSIYAMDFKRPNINPKVEAIKLEFSTLSNNPISGTEVQACKGLICFLNKLSTHVIWNPATRRHRQVPVVDKSYHGHQFCFGYDCKTNDYKLAMYYPERKKGTIIQVYSLKSDTWGPKRNYDFKIIGSPIYVDGVLYQIDCTSDDSVVELDVKIVVFDLATNERRVLPGPIKDRGHLGLGYHQGFIYVSCHYINNGHVDFWVISKNEGINYSWSKLVTIKIPLFFRDPGISPVGNLKELQKLLISEGYIMYWCYDIEKVKLEYLYTDDDSRVLDSCIYFESLVRV